MRSSTLEEKPVLAKSPSDEPRPVKSKRSTATPAAASPLAMRRAASTSFVQVKQWAASASPLLPENVARMTDGACMARPRLLVFQEAKTTTEVLSCRTDQPLGCF